MAENAPDQVSARQAWSLVASLFVAMAVVFGAGLQTSGIFLTPLQKYFGWSRTKVSLLAVGAPFVRGMTAPMVGYVIDRFDVRNIMIAGTAFSALCLLGIAGSNSFAPIMLALVLLGVGVAASDILPASLVIARWFEARRGLAMGITMAGTSVGGMVMTPVAQYAITRGGWRLGYMTLALPLVVVVIPLLALLVQSYPPTRKRTGGDPSPKPGSGLDVRAAVGTRTFWLIAFAQSCTGCAITVTLVHLVPYLIGLGYTPEKAAEVISITFGFSAVGVPLMGWLAERVGAYWALALNFVVQALAVSMVFGLRGASLLRLLPFEMALGLTFQSHGVLLPLVMVRSLGLRRYGSLAGIIRLCAAVSAALGPIVAGSIFDRTGSYTLAFEIVAGILALGAVAALSCSTLEVEEARIGLRNVAAGIERQ